MTSKSCNKKYSFLELSLRNCQNITGAGFSCLNKLEFLERLDLYRTSIETPTLCKILKKNPHMRHLSIAGMRKHFNADEVAVELGTSCPDLESVDFWKAMTLTWQGIDALSNCKNLREVDFSWWYALHTQLSCNISQILKYNVFKIISLSSFTKNILFY